MSLKMVMYYGLCGLCLVLLPQPAKSSCHFPKEIYQVKSGWRFMSPDYATVGENPHSWRQVRAEGERIHVEPMKEDGEPAGGDPVTYHCMQDAGEKMYAVMTNKDKNVLFYCLAFVVHSPYVVQWKMSKGGKMRQKCDENNLELVDSPMVFYEELEQLSIGSVEKVDCPLRGGFVITQWFDQDGNIGCETDALPPLKIESACERGEGLLFTGGGETCPSPHPKIPIDLQFNCVASWSNGKYTFMLINPQTPNGRLPCVRYPTQLTSRFKVDIFMDGVCDSTDPISQSHEYRMMTVALFLAEGICSDDTPACHLVQDTQCDAKFAKTCRKSCTACPKTPGWAHERFPDNFQGIWLKDSEKLGREKVQINNEFITIPTLGKYRTMGETICSRTSKRAPYGLTKQAKEYSMVQTFRNGCSHRMSIVQMVARSDSVLSFRVSKSSTVNWKIRMNEEEFKWQIMEGWQKWCSDVTFALPGEDPTNPYRTDSTGWFNLVQDGPDVDAINCTLPQNLLQDFHINIPSSGKDCSGSLTLEDGTLRMEVADCDPAPTASDQNGLSDSQFQCLAAFVGEHERTFLITRTPETHQNVINETYICWVFSTGQYFGEARWFRVSDCDANSDVYSKRGYRQELASFNFQHDNQNVEPYFVSSGEKQFPLLVIFNLAIFCAIFS